MKQVKGNKTIEISSQEIKLLSQNYPFTTIDLGTGDGRLVYESAKVNPKELYIGIDPVEKQMKEYSIKSIRKKLDNAVFLVSSFENIPNDFTHIADKISIILPWGSLLEKTVLAEINFIKKLSSMLKKDSEVEILFGYTQEFEPSEYKRLNLPDLTEEYISQNVVKNFEAFGKESNEKYLLKEKRSYDHENLKSFNTNWAKKLTFGKERKLFYLKFTFSR